MNIAAQARTAYDLGNQSIRSAKSVEYEAFARITRDLKVASDSGRKNYSALASAIHQNRKLWTILAADVADPLNALPADLKAQIFYLSEFTTHHSREVLREGASVDVLIEINRSIMQGLRTQAGAP